jgi:hypothetical protein
LEKYCRAGQQQMTIWCMRIACWTTKATHTLRTCSTYCFSIATTVTRTRLTVNYVLYLPCLKYHDAVTGFPFKYLSAFSLPVILLTCVVCRVSLHYKIIFCPCCSYSFSVCRNRNSRTRAVPQTYFDTP